MEGGRDIRRENEGDRAVEWNNITGGHHVGHMQDVFMCMNIEWVRFIIYFDVAVNWLLDVLGNWGNNSCNLNQGLKSL